MNKKAIHISLICLLVSISNSIIAQSHPNPFSHISKESNTISISKGRYVETILKDSLERIGTVIVNRYTRKIDKLLSEDSINQDMPNSSVQSRFLSIDPLSQAYAQLTPYQFASNRPIDGIDIDGKEWGQSICYEKKNGVLQTVTSNILRIKVINQSTIITDPKLIQAKAELFAQSLQEKYASESALAKTATEVVLDNKPASPNDANIAYLYFDDRKTKKTVVKMGSITTTTTSVVAGDTRGEINGFEIRVGITLDGNTVSDADLKETFQHEGGHSLGLNHPWKLNAGEIKLFPELNQLGAAGTFDTKKIMNNLLNSGENPDRTLWPNGSTYDLLPSQLDYINQQIKDKSLWSIEELKNPPANKP